MVDVIIDCGHTRVANSRINHDDILLVMLMQVRNQFPHLVNGEPLRVESEHFPATHVVDISPHSLKRDTSTTIVVDSLGDVEDILVAIATVVEL
jgi:hypothetical protein